VLLDRRQRWWFVFFVVAALAALSIHFLAGPQGHERRTGGGRVGLLFGIAGGILLLLTAFLAWHRYLPPWRWLGTRQTWLRIHIWFGSLGAVLIFCHTGFHFGGPFERVLYTLFLLTLVSGYLGLALQQFLPALLTVSVPCEIPYDQLPHLRRELLRRADGLAREILTPALPPARLRDADTLVKKVLTGALPAETRQELDQLFGKQVRPFLDGTGTWPGRADSPKLIDQVFAELKQRLPGIETVSVPLETLRGYCLESRALRDQRLRDRRTWQEVTQLYEKLVLPFLQGTGTWPGGADNPDRIDGVFEKVKGLPGLESFHPQLDMLRIYCRESQLLRDQERLAFWMHSWLYVHVPVSVAMLVLAAAHAFLTLYY